MHYIIALVLAIAGLFGLSQPASADVSSSSVESSSTIQASKDVSLPTYLPKVTTSHAQPAQCQEDEACWDCQTMGNLQCGPVVSDDQPAQCQEDEACWDCATMGNLQCGHTATMEQDAIGSFVSQTGMDTTNEALSLTLEYVTTSTTQPTDLPTGEFAIPSSNLDNTWHTLKWASFTRA